MSKTSLTPKQLQVLLAARPSAAGELADLDQILERVPYRTTKDSMQFTIRALIRHGMLEKAGMQLRRGRQRICYRLTGLAVAIVSPAPEAESTEEAPALTLSELSEQLSALEVIASLTDDPGLDDLGSELISSI
jgi:predicted transcriptional regulator